MLELEKIKKVSKKQERIRLGIDILRVASAGLIIVASPAMPNLVKLLPLLKLHRLKEYYEWDISRATRRLRAQGFLNLVPTHGGYALRPTHDGEVLLARYALGHFNISSQRRWDGKWRIIISDIKELRKCTREAIRMQLKRWGFYHLQKSVFVYPYECEEAVELLKTAHSVRHDMYYIVAQRMPGDGKLREYFGLLSIKK